MKRILICGASSFVANGFAKMAKKSGYSVDLFSRGQIIEEGMTSINGKYLSIADNKDLSTEYYAVINFAVLKDEDIENNVEYIKSLIRLCTEHKVKKLIHFSSIMAYTPFGQIDESTKIECLKETMMKGYGRIKIATDEYLDSVRGQLTFDIIQVRPGFVLANGMKAPFIKSLFSNVHVILGSKLSTLPIVRRDDIHCALLKILDKDKNLPVYLFFKNNKMTKFGYAQKEVKGLILTLPEWIFRGIPSLASTIGLMPKSVYSRFERMFGNAVYDNTQSEQALNFNFK